MGEELADHVEGQAYENDEGAVEMAKNLEKREANIGNMHWKSLN